MSPQGKLLELTAQGQSEVLDINRRGQRCGTTLVAVLIQEGYLSAISVGDSRIDLYRSGVLLQLNREHVNARVRDEESAFDGAPPVEGRRRAALTSYIGQEDLRELDRTLNPIQLVSGDRVLLMSDGVFGTLSDEQLVALLEQDAQKAADSIIKQVQMQKNQYQDNATVVVVEVK
jgi:serine/threonine protein phosphatase PrpC